MKNGLHTYVTLNELNDYKRRTYRANIDGWEWRNVKDVFYTLWDRLEEEESPNSVGNWNYGNTNIAPAILPLTNAGYSEYTTIDVHNRGRIDVSGTQLERYLYEYYRERNVFRAFCPVLAPRRFYAFRLVFTVIRTSVHRLNKKIETTPLTDRARGRVSISGPRPIPT